jgi:hypothetical protein
MPSIVDPADTARLDLAGDPNDYAPPSSGDTADFGPDFLRGGADSRPAEFQIHRFAEGIIRFYRARTILSRGADDALAGLAWSYLDRLEPDQLPAVARPAFFDLGYFVRLQTLGMEFDHEGFRRRVLDVATILDGFLDDFFLRAGD